MGYITYCQNDRNKKYNQVSIKLCGLLLLVILSLGLALCFLPASKNEYGEMAVVESISNSPGNLVIFAHIYTLHVVLCIDSHIKNIRIKDLGRLLI